MNLDLSNHSVALLGMDFVNLCNGTIQVGGKISLSLDSEYNLEQYPTDGIVQINRLQISNIVLIDELPDIL